jgi:hypothetical protein
VFFGIFVGVVQQAQQFVAIAGFGNYLYS